MNPLLYRILSRFGQQPYSRLMRGKTLGVRVAAISSDNRVMLVKQSYSAGWILPGGGVEKGEMLIEAALRELKEEAGVVADEPLTFHGIFSNEAIFPGDFVCLYLVRKFHREDWKPDLEISAAEFFPLDALPADITAGSKRRLDEIVHGQALTEQW